MAKHRSPSRIRYEEAHPTVTARVPARVKERLQALLEAEGLSFSAWIETVLEARAPDAEQIYRRGIEEGRGQGESVRAIVDNLIVMTEKRDMAERMLNDIAITAAHEITPRAGAYLREWTERLGMEEALEDWLRKCRLRLPY